jgi:hypothetical protein
MVGKHCGSCGLPNQLTSPILAIEIAYTWDDVLAIVGPCQNPHCGQSQDSNARYLGGVCKTICPDKVAALEMLQNIDRGFIVLYWLLFFYLGLINWRFCSWSWIGKIGGVGTVFFATLGALNDWREDDQILIALHKLHLIIDPSPSMRDFAYLKWRFLFLAIGLASPIFLSWPGKCNFVDERRSAFSQLIAWTTGVLALSTAWTGVAACLAGEDQRLEAAATRLDAVFIASVLTLATAQYWRGGTLAALNRIAKLPPFAQLAHLFSDH